MSYAPHEQRVIDEHQDLCINHSKLIDFIKDNPLFLNLDNEDASLMIDQVDAQAWLIEVLYRRINRFKSAD